MELGNGVAQLGWLLFLYLYLYSYFGLDLYDQIGKVCQIFIIFSSSCCRSKTLLPRANLMIQAELLRKRERER